MDKQENDRPVINIVVLLKKQTDYSEVKQVIPDGTGFSIRAMPSLQVHMNAGYNIIVSDKVIPADAYWIYATGGNKMFFPRMWSTCSTDKPVFIQCGSSIPSGNSISPGGKPSLKNAELTEQKFSVTVQGRKDNEGSFPAS